MPVCMMKLWLTVFAALYLALCCNGDNARLLASKNILNQYLVEGRDLTVQYTIYNTGGSAALDVTLKDDGFAEADFEVVRGNLNVRWERIAPYIDDVLYLNNKNFDNYIDLIGTNVTHAIILKPLQYGYFNFTSGVVSYKDSDDATEAVFGYTSSPGEGGIVNSKEYDRRFSPHVLDWCVFAVMTLPSLVIPFLLFYRSKSRYDQPKMKKN